MFLYPKFYFEKITDISVDFLKENEIKGLVLDVDNTIIDFNLKILEGLEKWHDEIQNSGIKTMILSNTNKIQKVKNVADILNIDYINFAKKPLKQGFIKAKNKLELDYENIASIGDQIFTDVWGANRVGMISILVKPLDKKDIWITRLKRPLENFVIKKYLKTKEVK